MDNKYLQIKSNYEIIKKIFTPKGKIIIDMGCGSGDFVRLLAEKGAQIIGLDKPNPIYNALQLPLVGTEKYLVGNAEYLPFKDNFADIITYIASFHLE